MPQIKQGKKMMMKKKSKVTCKGKRDGNFFFYAIKNKLTNFTERRLRRRK